MFTYDVISLTEMTPETTGAYFKDFAFDDAVFLEGQLLHPFVYSKQCLTGYLERNKDSVHLAIMPKDAPVGEILFK